jgi:hypothetical protein
VLFDRAQRRLRRIMFQEWWGFEENDLSVLSGSPYTGVGRSRDLTASFQILPEQQASRFFQNCELPDSSRTVSFQILPKQ